MKHAEGLLVHGPRIFREFYPRVGRWLSAGSSSHAAWAGMGDDFAWKIDRDQALAILYRFDPEAVLPTYQSQLVACQKQDDVRTGHTETQGEVDSDRHHPHSGQISRSCCLGIHFDPETGRYHHDHPEERLMVPHRPIPK